MKDKSVYGFALLLGFLGVAIVLIRTGLYGPGITHDSISYYFAAKSFVRGDGFQYFGYPSPIIQWPILFPFIFGCFERLSLDLLQAARWFNAIVFGATIFSAAFLTKKVTKRSAMAILSALLVMTSFPTFDQSAYFWTEPLFTLLGIWIFYGIIRSNQEPSMKRYAALAGILAGLSVLLRFAGATYVMAMCLCLMVARGSFKERVTRTFIFGFLGTFPFALNVFSNFRQSGTLMGMRTPALRSLSDNLLLAADVLKRWMFPSWEAPLPHIGHYGGLFLCLLIFVLLLAVLSKSRRARVMSAQAIQAVPSSNWNTSGTNSGYGDIGFAWFTVTVYAAVYLIYMIASASAVNFDPIDARYLQPVYLPLIFMFTWLVSLCFKGVQEYKYILALLVLVIFWQLPNVVQEARVTSESLESGVGGANIAQWHETDLFEIIEKRYGSQRLYSNRADLISFYAHTTCYYTPKLEGIDLYGLAFMKKDLKANPNAYLIWFKGHDPNYIYSPAQLGEIMTLDLVEETETYRVYRMGQIRE